ncbi:trypsin-like peptidase domain-containing protein [Nostoc sp.]|uniref:trypsin-like peptidase domain-containing protein n=1 Tax=Nostoc sp. TaxID=1180 RepID=UPI002FF54B55
MLAEFTRIRESIQENDLDLAIQKLKAVTEKNSSRFRNEVLLHSGSLKSLQGNVRKGIVNSQDAKIEEKQIRLALLELTDSIEKALTSKTIIAPEPEFAAKIDDEQILEAIINSADNFLDIYMLPSAFYCAQAVARIEIPEGIPKGTGFLIGPDLLLTNQHVLKEQSYLEEAVARFGYMANASDIAPLTGKVVPIRQDFYFASPAKELDYALVRLQDKPIETTATVDELRKKSIADLASIGKHRGYLLLQPRRFIEYSRVNIIQHPKGGPLKVVMTQNYVVHTTNSRVQYVADTEDGSSGAPVFDQNWGVVALHHSGNPYPSESLSDSIKKVLKGRFRVNEGIPMRAILEDFKFKGIDRYLPCD